MKTIWPVDARSARHDCERVRVGTRGQAPDLVSGHNDEWNGPGDRQRRVVQLLGIPFAAPPLGNLRWKPPQPAAPWLTTLNATAGVACPQVNPAGSTTVMGNENCLKLNVWTRIRRRVVGADHCLDSHRRLHGGFAEPR